MANYAASRVLFKLGTIIVDECMRMNLIEVKIS